MAGVPGRAQPTSDLVQSNERDLKHVHVPLGHMNEWASSRATDITCTIASWRKEVTHLQSENERLRRELNDLKERAAIASERALRDHPNVEDITDPKRPSQIGQSYSLFIDAERMDAIEKLDKEFQETSENERLVCEVFEIAFGIATTAINSVRQHIPWALANPASLCTVKREIICEQEDMEIYVKYVARRALSAQSRGGHVQNIMDNVCTYLKTTSDSVDTTTMEKAVIDEVKTKYPSDNRNWMNRKLSLLDKYISQCCRLAWQLVVQTPSMHIQYSETQFDPAKHRLSDKIPDGTSTRIYYLWPTLLSRLNGNVVCKGIVSAVESTV